MTKKQVFAGVLGILLGMGGEARAVFSFADIEYWTGSGSNEAALVVDWLSPYDGTSQDFSGAWGFRFDAGATGLDMMNTIAAADARFSFTDLGGGFIRDIAYDPDLDGADDYFWPGYDAATTNYWNQWEADGVEPYNGGTWTAGGGIASHDLTDGSWSGWRYDNGPVAFGGDGITPREPVGIQAVPEPGSILLMILGLAGAGRAASRRSRMAGRE